MLTSNKHWFIDIDSIKCTMSWNSGIFESSLEEPREELPPKKRKLCEDDGEEVRSEPSKKPTRKPASKLCEAGLTIGKRIPALSNDWALTISLSLTGKNFSALVSA